MSDSEVERAARFLATQALLLLSVGMLAAAMSVAVIVWATHLAARFRSAAQRTVAAVATRVQEPEIVRRLIDRARRWAPSAYLVLHLTLGLVLAVAVAVFATLAEEALAAGELAAFDRETRGGTTAAEVGRSTRTMAHVSVGDYINVATNALLALVAIMLVRRYIQCWKADR